MKKFIYLLVILISCANLLSQHPEWTQYTCGKSVTALVEDGDFIWIGTSGGFVKMNKITEEMTFFNNANSGLPGNDIKCLALDSSKNLWIGTYNNITKFDGSLWTVFNSSNSDLPYLEYIIDIEVDSNNILYLATHRNIYKLENENFTLFDVPFTYFNLYNSKPIYLDKNNNLWIANARDFAKFDGKSWTKYELPDSIFDNGAICDIVVDINETVFLAVPDIGIIKFHNNTWKEYSSNTQQLYRYCVQRLAIDQNNEIWAGGNGCFLKYIDDGWHCPWLHKDSFWYITYMMPDKEGNIWIADKDDGIAKFIENDSVMIYNPSNSGLFEQKIAYIAIEDSIKWIAPHYYGFSKFNDEKWTTDIFLPFDFVNQIAIDKFKNKWLATEDGLFKYNNEEILFWDSTDTGLPIGRVYSLDIEMNNNIWIASAWEGLFKFDGLNWVVYDTSNSGIPSDELFCVAIDTKDNKWLGTYYGLVKYDNEKFTVYDSSNSDLPDNIINCIKIDENDVIWVGTENGLVRIQDDKWDIYNDSLTSFPENKITNINIDRSDNIWVGFHYSGIAKFDGSYWKFYNVSNSGLPDDNINCIAVDSAGKIWVATDGGIGVLDESVIGVEENKFEKGNLFISNFPNPFSERTKFRYYLVQPANVSLAIYNSLGQEIAVLVDGWQAGGEQEIKFDGSGLSAGVYYFRQIVGQEFYSGKVILVR